VSSTLSVICIVTSYLCTTSEDTPIPSEFLVVVFGRPFVKRYALRCRTIVLSCLSLTLVYCGQTAEWNKMKLGVEVGLVPSHIVLMRTQLPLQKGTEPLNFRPISVVAKQSPISDTATAEHLYAFLYGGATGRALDLRSRVQILLGATLHNNLGQVVHIYVPLSPSSITWCRPKGGDALRLRR